MIAHPIGAVGANGSREDGAHSRFAWFGDVVGKATAGKLLFAWRWAVMRSDLPSSSKLILHTLGFHMDVAGNRCQVGAARLSSETGLTRRTIQTHLVDLNGTWVRITRSLSPDGDSAANQYFPLLPNKVAQEVQGVAQEMRHPSAGVAPGVAQELRPNTTVNSRGNSPTRKKHIFPEEFERVWAIHGRGAKAKAHAEWKGSVPDLVSQADLVNALRAYVKTFGADFKGCHLVRWIRDERWEDGRGTKAPSVRLVAG